jgi:hypothetical protein
LPQARNTDTVIPKEKANRYRLLAEIKIRRELGAVAIGGSLPLLNGYQHRLMKTADFLSVYQKMDHPHANLPKTAPPRLEKLEKLTSSPHAEIINLKRVGIRYLRVNREKIQSRALKL